MTKTLVIDILAWVDRFYFDDEGMIPCAPNYPPSFGPDGETFGLPNWQASGESLPLHRRPTEKLPTRVPWVETPDNWDSDPPCG